MIIIMFALFIIKLSHILLLSNSNTIVKIKCLNFYLPYV